MLRPCTQQDEEVTMPMRSANAVWNGSLTEGNGTMRMASGAYEGPYTFESRFEEGEGTNPEELIAAAHAGCFSMALSGELNKAGHTPDSVETEAIVHLEKVEGGFAIKRIDLRTRVNAPGVSESELQEAAEAAKKGCPVSQAVAAVETIELDAQLAG
jgi:lipoyl-dependent peroxiredoxin